MTSYRVHCSISHHAYYLIGLLLYHRALLIDKDTGYAKIQRNVEWLHNTCLKENVVFNIDYTQLGTRERMKQ